MWELFGTLLKRLFGTDSPPPCPVDGGATQAAKAAFRRAYLRYQEGGSRQEALAALRILFDVMPADDPTYPQFQAYHKELLGEGSRSAS